VNIQPDIPPPTGTPDQTYLRGATEALGELRRRLILASKLGQPINEATVHQMLRDAAAEIGIDEAAP
jgi:predicted translin family RNA/ssDNA-binding protein